MNGGVLMFNANNTASTNSTENVGTITLNSGANQIRIFNASSGTAVISLNINSLVRNNNSTVSFVGTTLGGSPTAADDIKFNTAPTLSGAADLYP